MKVGDRVKGRFSDKPGTVVTATIAGVSVLFDGETEPSAVLHRALHLVEERPTASVGEKRCECPPEGHAPGCARDALTKISKAETGDRREMLVPADEGPEGKRREAQPAEAGLAPPLSASSASSHSCPRCVSQCSRREHIAPTCFLASSVEPRTSEARCAWIDACAGHRCLLKAGHPVSNGGCEGHEYVQRSNEAKVDAESLQAECAAMREVLEDMACAHAYCMGGDALVKQLRARYEGRPQDLSAADHFHAIEAVLNGDAGKALLKEVRASRVDKATSDVEKPFCDVCGEEDSDGRIGGKVEVCRLCWMGLEHSVDVLKDLLDYPLSGEVARLRFALLNDPSDGTCRLCGSAPTDENKLCEPRSDSATATGSLCDCECRDCMAGRHTCGALECPGSRSETASLTLGERARVAHEAHESAVRECIARLERGGTRNGVFLTPKEMLEDLLDDGRTRAVPTGSEGQ